jgi:cytochrome c oxidase cbb3-type subunit 3
MKRLSILAILSLVSFSMFAAEEAQNTFLPGLKTGQELFVITLLGLMTMICAVIIVVTLNLNSQIRNIFKPKTESSEFEQAMQNRTFWQKFWSLKPIQFEKDQIMEHQYDGIAELDNPTPPWFMYLFYITIVVGIFYLIGYHVIGNGKIMNNEYTEEVTIAEKAREEYMKKFANSVNEDNVKVLTDAKGVEDGKKIYTQNCVACHGANGEGVVYPNLTDEYWLHGGTPKAIFHTINEGVPEKGMISWKKTLNPIQVQQVLSYIVSIQGTKPANAKAPQGDKAEAAVSMK